MPRLLCFGLGYSAKALAHHLKARPPEAERGGGWSVIGTSRSAEGCRLLDIERFEALPFDGTAPLPKAAFDSVTHVLSSIAPGDSGDPVLRHHRETLNALAESGQVEWVGYLSSTGVYGNREGGWVDEDSPVDPSHPRSMRRAQAERAWLHLSCPAHVFRLAGIYGPGRNALEQVKSGTARRIIKPGHLFGRIHVEDIAGALCAALDHPHPGRIYNLCDDEPAAGSEVIAHAARLLGQPLPPEIPFEEAVLSPMAQSFYADNRKVSNARMKAELGYRLKYPTYREGLEALL